MSEAEVVTLWGADQTPYLTRVILGRLRVHIFHRGDGDPDCHDHPADFWTFPLVSYIEEYIPRPWLPVGEQMPERRLVQAFRLHRRPAGFAHRVIAPATGPGQIATIVWWGKKRREWGFHTPRGWVDWRTYTNTPLPTPGDQP